MKKLVFSSMVLVASLLPFGTGYAVTTDTTVTKEFCDTFAQQFAGSFFSSDQHTLAEQLKFLAEKTSAEGACALAPHQEESCSENLPIFIENCPVPEEPTPPPAQ